MIPLWQEKKQMCLSTKGDLISDFFSLLLESGKCRIWHTLLLEILAKVKNVLRLSHLYGQGRNQGIFAMIF